MADGQENGPASASRKVPPPGGGWIHVVAPDGMAVPVRLRRLIASAEPVTELREASSVASLADRDDGTPVLQLHLGPAAAMARAVAAGQAPAEALAAWTAETGALLAACRRMRRRITLLELGHAAAATPALAEALGARLGLTLSAPKDTPGDAPPGDAPPGDAPEDDAADALSLLLAEAALNFGSYEFFWLALFGVVISGRLTAFDDPIKGYVAGLLGLMVAMVGMEGLHGFRRFTFGIQQLGGGIDLIPAMVGAFGLAEILVVMKRRLTARVVDKTDHVVPRFAEVWKYRRTTLRSGVIGTFVGIVPGVGEDIGAWGSYAAARRASKEAHLFGKGSYEGLIASETGNSAAIPGSMIPTLTLALPGSAAAAVLIAAMFIHGIRPGPMLMVENAPFLFKVVAMLVLATVAITIYGLALTRPLLRVMMVPRERLMPVVYVLCVIGAFAITQRMFDVYVMLVFGIVGFLLREMRYPMAPLVMGIILGDLLDVNLRRGLQLSNGDLSPFFTRPISAFICGLIVLSIVLSIPFVQRRVAALVKPFFNGRSSPDRGGA